MPEPVSSRQGQSGQQVQPPAESSGKLPAMDLANLRRLWPDVLESIKKRKRFAWMVLSDNATPLSLTASELTLGFRSSGSRLGFSSGGSDIHLREALLEVVGIDVTVTCVDAPGQGSRPGSEASGSPPPRVPAAARTQPPAGWDDEPARTPSEGGPVPAARPDSDAGADANSDSDAVTDPEQEAVNLVSRSLGARKIGEWDNT